MKVLTDLEIERAAVLKSVRAAIRLKHSLAADREIAERLPVVESEIDAALQAGLSYELNPAAVFDEN